MNLLPARYPVLKTVIVNTKTDKAFRGVLWQRRAGYLVLRNAVLLQARGEPLAVDGELLIEVANVDFLQVII